VLAGAARPFERRPDFIVPKFENIDASPADHFAQALLAGRQYRAHLGLREAGACGAAWRPARKLAICAQT